MPSTWGVTTITSPGSTGSVAYTPAGWGGKTPRALIFYGTNWQTEDAAQTSNGLGVFRGLCAEQWDSPGTLNQQAGSVICTPAGNAHSTQNQAIRMLNTAGGATALYVASVTSLDSGGFTLNWTTAASGYKIVVIALFDVVDCAAIVAAFNGTSRDLGFKAGSALLQGGWSTPIDGTDRTQEFYGGASYPTGLNTNWSACGGTVFTFPTSPSGQYVCEVVNNAPHIRVATGGHFTASFLTTANITAFPSGSPAAGNNFVVGGDSADAGITVVWDDEDSRCFFQTPAASSGATSTKTGLPFAPGLLLGYTISNEPTGQGTGSRGAIGFAVVAPGFQWCATVDGASSQGAFQSFQRGICDAVSGTSVHTGTVELTDDGFVITTEEDDIGQASVVWHAFGHPDEEPTWIPQSFRRW